MTVQTLLFALGTLVVVWLAFKLAKFAFRFLKYILLLALAGFLVWYYLFRPQGAPALPSLNWNGVFGTLAVPHPTGNADANHKTVYHFKVELF